MPDNASTLGLLSDLLSRLALLARQELALARVEIREKLALARNALVAILLGCALCFAALLALLHAAVSGLATVMPLWAASLAVGLALVALGLLFIRAGATALDPDNLKPERSLRSLRERKARFTETLT